MELRCVICYAVPSFKTPKGANEVLKAECSIAGPITLESGSWNNSVLSLNQNLTYLYLLIYKYLNSDRSFAISIINCQIGVFKSRYKQWYSCSQVSSFKTIAKSLLNPVNTLGAVIKTCIDLTTCFIIIADDPIEKYMNTFIQYFFNLGQWLLLCSKNCIRSCCL